MAMDHRKEFTKRYAECHEAFLRYCSALSFGRMDVEDLVQDVLLSAYQNYQQLADKDKLLHYLLRAARNRAISLRKRQRRMPGIIDTQAKRLAARGASPEQLADVHLLYRALDKLPNRQREALILFELTGYSIREIAKLQGRTQAGVKMGLSRGRKQLAKLLTDPQAPVADKSLSSYFQTASILLL